MSVIVQQPDSLSFAGNLKKFVVTSAVTVALQLNKGAEQILNEIYQPGAGSIVEIDLRTVIDKVLSVTLPGTNLITEQSSGFADFTATIDGTAVAFRVIKGGVLELGSMASDFVNEHFLTWQIQDKTILQHQPEWLTVYTNAARNLMAKAYYQDNTNASMLLTALDAGKLLAVDVSWASVNALFVKKNPIAWEVWCEDLAGTRLSYVQRYCLRNSDDEEKIFIWANTMGGIDSISLTGSAEDDKKLEHLIAEMGDESLQEYQTDKKREIKQSTGFLTVDESRWIEDFFYSSRRYLVSEDGAVRSIVLASSKIVGSTADDLFDYEFNYRLASESQLLNLDRSFDSLPALEVPVDFFLTELLSGLPVAQYSNGLLLAVQSPFSQTWQQLSMAQLWGSALPGLVDGVTISVVNGKLQVNGVSGGVGVSAWGDLTDKPFSTLSNLFSVSPEGVLTLANTYALFHTHPYISDADARITNWNSAFTWGNHATAGYAAAHTHPYRPDTWVPSWAEITSKPTWTEKMGWDGTAVTIAGDLHVTGKIISDGSMQFYGISSGGTGGGGGASALWQLSDVADEMEFSINGDIPLYNGTHFTRYNISNLATYGHLHSIAQVTGLQGALDGKQPLLGYTPYYASNFVAGVNYSAPHSHPYLSDSDARIANWSTAFGWGNHAGLYRQLSYVPSWTEVTSKPTWTDKMGWDGAAVTIAGDLHVTGKIISDGSMQFFGTSAGGGTGGGGSTTLWGLSDVSDDVANAVYGDLIMYNGTHFVRINQSVLAPAVHTHSIAQVTGLQGALDGKQAAGNYAIDNANISNLNNQLLVRGSWTAYQPTNPDILPSTVFQGVNFGYDANNYASITNPIGSNELYFGRWAYGWQGWNKIWHSGNFNPASYVLTGDSRLSDSRVASDVYVWAKASIKPSYVYSEIGGTVPTWNQNTTGTALNATNWSGSGVIANYLPLAGGTLTGGLIGTIATFSSQVVVNQTPNSLDANIYLSQPTSSWVTVAAFNSFRFIKTVSGALDGNFKAFNVGAGGVSIGYDNTPTYSSADALLVRGNGVFSGSVTATTGLNITGNGGFFNGANKFGIDNNAGTTRLYFSGPDVNTRGLVEFHANNSNGTSDNIVFRTTVYNENIFSGSIYSESYISTPTVYTYQNSMTGVQSIQMTNTSIANAAGKYCALGFFLSDSVGTRKWAGDIRTVAENGNVIDATMQFVVRYLDGYERIGMTLDSGGSLSVLGNIFSNGTIQFYTASDRRLKTDFETIIDPIEKIKSLTGYFFNYNDEGMRLGGYAKRRDIGLIAQDVDAILPEACGTLWGTHYMGYKADKLIPLLVEAIKAQQIEIDHLKKQVA